MSKQGLWRPLETMELKFGSCWVPSIYLGIYLGIWIFSRFFFVRKMEPLLKHGPKSKELLVLEGGYPGALSDLSPPPWANPRYVPELQIDERIPNLVSEFTSDI